MIYTKDMMEVSHIGRCVNVYNCILLKGEAVTAKVLFEKSHIDTVRINREHIIFMISSYIYITEPLRILIEWMR